MATFFDIKCFSQKKCFQKNHFSEKYFRLKTFQRWAYSENHKYFLYFHSIIFAYKSQFLFTT
jgi:hypothetical protein